MSKIILIFISLTFVSFSFAEDQMNLNLNSGQNLKLDLNNSDCEQGYYPLLVSTKSSFQAISLQTVCQPLECHRIYSRISLGGTKWVVAKQEIFQGQLRFRRLNQEVINKSQAITEVQKLMEQKACAVEKVFGPLVTPSYPWFDYEGSHYTEEARDNIN